MHDKRFLQKADAIVEWLSVLVILASCGVIVKGCIDWYARPEVVTVAETAEEPDEMVRLYFLAEDEIIREELAPTKKAQDRSKAPTPKEQEAPARKYLGRFYITGYDICVECCGKTDGITASGTQATLGRTVAAGPEIPFGTVLYIDGIGERVVEDRGTGVTEGCLDVLCEDHAACYAITGWYDVYIMEDK